MIKCMAMIKRKAGISREEFIRHYEEHHAPLAVKHFGFARYVRNFVIPAPGADETPFDVIAEYWFEDQAAFAKMVEFNASPAAQGFREDEQRFMETSTTVGYLVDERISPLP